MGVQRYHRRVLNDQLHAPGPLPPGIYCIQDWLNPIVSLHALVKRKGLLSETELVSIDWLQ